MTNPLTRFFASHQADGIAWLESDNALKSLREGWLANPTTFGESCGSEKSCLKAGPLTIDLQGHWMNPALLECWVSTYKNLGFEEKRQALLSGEPINITEGRPAWHTALRQSQPPEAVQVVQKQMAECYDQLRSAPPSGVPITDIVNVGVGGSDLGPCMIANALRPLFPDAPNTHYISNVDGTPLSHLLNQLDPKSTVFVVSSKTFTTLETMTNFQSVLSWFKGHGFEQSTIGQHLFAATANPDAAKALDIPESQILPLWDWVGGRYSVWSAIGLSLVLAFGYDTFQSLLSGANAMDQHFEQAPLEQNAPALLAALDAWYSNYFNAQTLAIIPYESSLELLPNYLQQLMMESNGKGVTQTGEPVTWRTGQIVWGGVGTNTQHSFHQLLHQGTQLVPIDFMIGLEPMLPLGEHHTHLAANCLAQTEALAAGHSPSTNEDPLAHHKYVAGNKPFTLMSYPRLNAEVIGALLALYEHRVYCQSLLWNILAFDQWGVELGKVISKQLTPTLKNQGESSDSIPQRLKPFINGWQA